jgi:hypothetical protein
LAEAVGPILIIPISRCHYTMSKSTIFFILSQYLTGIWWVLTGYHGKKQCETFLKNWMLIGAIVSFFEMPCKFLHFVLVFLQIH